MDLLYKVARLQNMDLVKQRVDLKKLSEENYAELVDKVEELVEFVEDAVPGPGHYSVTREFDHPGKGHKFSRKGASTTVDPSGHLGPGTYSVQKIGRKDFSTHEGFQQTGQQRAEVGILSEVPGPGRYDVEANSIK